MLEKTISDKYTFQNNTYITKEKDFETEIGDIKQPNFEPQIKIKRWDNEANASFRLIDTSSGTPVISTEGNKIKWIKDKIEAHFYDLGLGEGGGYEFEIIFKEKPATNKLEFSIETKELDFFYQTKLTQEEKDSGISRPEDVECSYAVYHKTKSGDTTALGGKNYKAGKAFHIYRPKIIDATGKWVWGELNIDVDVGIQTITIPQDFLVTAVYPIRHVAGERFGYDTEGGTNISSGNDYCYANLSAGAVGVGVSMSVSCANSGKGIRMALYKDSDNSLVDETSEGSTPATQDWVTANFTGSPTLNAIDYKLAFQRGTDMNVYGDNIGAARWYDAQTYGSWADPITWDGGPLFNWQYSVYVTYTLAAPPGIASLRQLIGVGQGTR